MANLPLPTETDYSHRNTGCQGALYRVAAERAGSCIRWCCPGKEISPAGLRLASRSTTPQDYSVVGRSRKQLRLGPRSIS